MKTEINSRYSPCRKVITVANGELITEQAHAARLNPNRIVAKAKQTGMLPTVQRMAQYGDFSQVGDYMEAQAQIIAANDAFMALPAKIRDRFKNDPAYLLTFLAEESNREEAEKLGLIEPKKKEEITPKPAEGVPTPKSGTI